MHPRDERMDFDYGYGPDSSQDEVNKDIGREVVNNALSGYNSVVFAYGKTGSGKTFTMTQLIDFVLEELLAAAASKQAASAKADASSVNIQLHAYYFEIYNEDIYDLWGPSGRRKVSRPMFVDRKTGYADLQSLGITKESVRGLKEMQALLGKGRDARATSATKLNAHSSRSHAILRLECTQSGCAVGGHGNAAAVRTFSCHDLVDLAGAENTRASGATGVNQAEAGKINQSLVTLQRVIEALFRISKLNARRDASSQHPAQVFVPYRDSKLTHLLRPSLGGNAKAFMIATVSPADRDATTSTLDYARKCAQVVNHVKVNVSESKQEATKESKKALGKYKAEVDALSRQLKLTQAQLVEQRAVDRGESAFADTLCAKDARIAALEQQVTQMRAESALKSKEIEAMRLRSEAVVKSSQDLREALQHETSRTKRAQERAQFSEEGLRHYKTINEALCTAIDKLQAVLPGEHATPHGVADAAASAASAKAKAQASNRRMRSGSSNAVASADADIESEDDDDDDDGFESCTENANPNARKTRTMKEFSGTLESLARERDFVRQMAAAHIGSLESQLGDIAAHRDELYRLTANHVAKAMDHVQRLEQSVLTAKDRLGQAFEDSDHGDLSNDDLQEVLATTLTVMFVVSERLCGTMSEDLDHVRLRLAETAPSSPPGPPPTVRKLDLNTTADFFDLESGSEASDNEQTTATDPPKPVLQPRDQKIEPKTIERTPSRGVSEFLESMDAMAAADLSELGIFGDEDDENHDGFATPVGSPRAGSSTAPGADVGAGSGPEELPRSTGNTGIPYVWRFQAAEPKMDGLASEKHANIKSTPLLEQSEKRVTVLGGVHGNELVGIRVVKRLLSELEAGHWEIDQQGAELVLGLGNPEAIKKGTRGSAPGGDLNRSFPLELAKSIEGGEKAEAGKAQQLNLTFEEQRARELGPLLMKTDILLDIHAANTPSDPFIRIAGRCTEDHMRVASWFAGLSNQEESRMKLLLDPFYRIGGKVCTTDEFVNVFGGTGVCLETGLYNDISMEQECYTRLVEMLNHEVGLRDTGKASFSWPAVMPSSNIFLRPYGVTHLRVVKEKNTTFDEANFAQHASELKEGEEPMNDAQSPNPAVTSQSSPRRAAEATVAEDLTPRNEHPREAATQAEDIWDNADVFQSLDLPVEQDNSTSPYTAEASAKATDDVEEVDDFELSYNDVSEIMSLSEIQHVHPSMKIKDLKPELERPNDESDDTKEKKSKGGFWVQNVYSNLFRPFEVVSSHLLTERGFAFEKGVGERNWQVVHKGQILGKYAEASRSMTGGTEQSAEEPVSEELYVALENMYVLFPKPEHLRTVHRPLYWLAREIDLPRAATNPVMAFRTTKDGLFTWRQFSRYLERLYTKNRTQFLEHLHLSPALQRKGANDPWTFVSPEGNQHFSTNTGELASKLTSQVLGDAMGGRAAFRIHELLGRYRELDDDDYVRKDLRDSMVYFPFENSRFKKEGLLVYPTTRRVAGEHFLQCGSPYVSPRISMPFAVERFDKGKKSFLGVAPLGEDANPDEVRGELEEIAKAVQYSLPWVDLVVHDNYILSEVEIEGDAYLMCDHTLPDRSNPTVETVSVRGTSFPSVGATYYSLWKVMYTLSLCRRAGGAQDSLAEIHPVFSVRGELLNEFAWQRELPEPIRPVYREEAPNYPLPRASDEE
ncbi:Kinesin-like protein [Hondaea fermentalgiana]|uniref:Kinesin-like protein n=1 Tax=Hondaea fermentalgiana TaxID=2315210 RepID=A0A2R5GZ40_9STRA|nr:Kinesin-like protein [Hondaea fermentalgiana]|eukprot:GBG33284.1 Kinesin-like protein [Hondaea fermentalgiana]